MTATSLRDLHVGENLAASRVVLDVAGLAAELHRRDPMARRVEHRLDAAALVGDEHVPLDRVVGESVRVAAGRRCQRSPRPVRLSIV